jgi:hypothetical protein
MKTAITLATEYGAKNTNDSIGFNLGNNRRQPLFYRTAMEHHPYLRDKPEEYQK